MPLWLVDLKYILIDHEIRYVAKSILTCWFIVSNFLCSSVSLIGRGNKFCKCDVSQLALCLFITTCYR